MLIPHCGISNCGVFMEFLYSITVYKCGVYNIPEKLQMTTTSSTYYGTDLVFPVYAKLRLEVRKTESDLLRAWCHSNFRGRDTKS